ncbi:MULTISPECIES: hypothetical protein [unclassified Paenibacillus]|uniref:hypothetical protein n=1 Tax=unclassified Paenibacillus TaxID=185978 RepID=UPI002787C7C9|nr:MULTISPECIES: hypothetical protein [unclassified Paenibacillus]MDQ0896215.1 hypothetical protein [Paenibacillus sp. V4I7]MDQ0913969.1 hypothetical protein [Paenibacillus sp. V4I5]
MRKVIIGASGVALMAISVVGNLYFSKLTEVKFTSTITVKPTRLLKSGEIIEASMLRQVSIPEAAHVKEAIIDSKDLLGKEVLVPVGENEEIASWKVGTPGYVPREGERYYSFKTDVTTNVNNMVRLGDSVDVWVEFDSPKLIRTPNGLETIGAVKIIEGLRVTSIKTAEGVEVWDVNALENLVQSDSDQLANSRAKSTGKPETNTYIMNDDTYSAYALGSIGGKIKLALPNLNKRDMPPAKVTDSFLELQRADAFSKQNKGEVTVKSNLKDTEVKGSNSSAQQPQSSTPPVTPTATEVRK